MNQLPLLPDFNAVSHSYAIIAEEFTKVGNLEAISGAQETREAVRRLEVQVRETSREQREMLSNIQRMLENSVRENQVTTGEVIRRFPRDVAAINGLQDGSLNRLLDELGCETDGTEEDKRRRLKLACGVTNMAV
ncbi:hypothetical protein FBEOM_13609 [Fusarium beomiforme]|uniref:Uncharacterized protein n=1 Tax=Fusarium beomiforme TaxID=44412 RepID=A0A9P5DNB6_9HYPO|nr:hypothetical protein FBEOM_13609 [Fusarium beomiforme]